MKLNYSNDIIYVKGKNNMNDTLEPLLAVDDVEEYRKALVLYRKSEMGESIVSELIKVHNDLPAFKKFIKSLSQDGFKIFQTSRTYGSIIDYEYNNYVSFSLNENTISFDMVGDFSFIENFSQDIKNHFTEIGNKMRWYYNDKGACMDIPLDISKAPVDEMYPFLENKGQTLKEYYDSYLHSNASIILLIGPPGTGKTTFIKGLLEYSKSSAVLSYNISLLNDDELFVDFIGSRDKFLIMEDCDSFIQSRKDGNTMMHRFLNVSDGLVSISGKKIIFTTNLESTQDIDPALIRPGRCFDVLEFDYLNYTQAEKLAKKFKKQFVMKDDAEYSIADVMCEVKPDNKEKTTNYTERSIGFKV